MQHFSNFMNRVDGKYRKMSDDTQNIMMPKLERNIQFFSEKKRGNHIYLIKSYFSTLQNITILNSSINTIDGLMNSKYINANGLPLWFEDYRAGVYKLHEKFESITENLYFFDYEDKFPVVSDDRYITRNISLYNDYISKFHYEIESNSRIFKTINYSIHNSIYHRKIADKYSFGKRDFDHIDVESKIQKHVMDYEFFMFIMIEKLYNIQEKFNLISNTLDSFDIACPHNIREMYYDHVKKCKEILQHDECKEYFIKNFPSYFLHFGEQEDEENES